ncbi:DUF3810 domain-containing protein [Sphingobacterium deserti]|uniref:DUF3810 domain-containing protein n=1 Tax=Sphingobacterium deserti TaxID=1229276 RepID=A0A0B8TC89_9SPHI|nr:DUF3810 domain-containing protein [Sphingobacterium deserti]KGE15960.1 conserved hypothetical protein, membrane [Sphingobacterium deserti]
MKTKHSRNITEQGGLRHYLVTLGLLLIALFIITGIQQFPELVESYYSRAFYPIFSHLHKWLFGWLPFSFGDVFYAGFVSFILLLIIRCIVTLFRKQGKLALRQFLQLAIVLLSSYLYFYISWGLNYYRVPLQEQLDLDVAEIDSADYFEVLDRYITTANALRAGLPNTDLLRKEAKQELEALMKEDTTMFPMLSRTQIRAKQPISSSLASYFSVTGYLNPFTQEVQVNNISPTTSYPFTVVHELAHQMGVGFEDECNFIAFVALHNHPNTYYRYAAYYETVQYLIRPLYYQDEQRYQFYVDKLSDAVKQDYADERRFWKTYSGPLDRFMSFFYAGYLKHNNQPEGVARYSLMSRLVIAWDKKKQHKT